MSRSHCSRRRGTRRRRTRSASRRPSGALSTKSIRYAADPELRHRPEPRVDQPAQHLPLEVALAARSRPRPSSSAAAGRSGVRQQQRPRVVGVAGRRPHRVEDPQLVAGPGRGDVDPAVVVALGERAEPPSSVDTTMDTSTTSRSSPWNVYASPTRSRRALHLVLADRLAQPVLAGTPPGRCRAEQADHADASCPAYAGSATIAGTRATSASASATLTSPYVGERLPHARPARAPRGPRRPAPPAGRRAAAGSCRRSSVAGELDDRGTQRKCSVSRIRSGERRTAWS